MKSVNSLLMLAICAMIARCSFAVVPADVTTPGDLMQLVNGVNDGDGNSGPPPGAEGVEHAIDNFGQKYLNFLDLGSGFIVTPSVGAGLGGTIVTGIRLYTANDAVERDPASYELAGSLNGVNFSIISSGPLSLPAARNPGGNVALGANLESVSFNNSNAYTSYRLIFPTLKDAGVANSMQISEVELLGVVVPEPAGLSILAMGVIGLLRRARRQA